MSNQGRRQGLSKIALRGALLTAALILSVGPVSAQGADCEQTFPNCDGTCPNAGEVCVHVPGTTVVLPSPDLPPESDPTDPECQQIVSMYEGEDLHARYPNGIEFSDPRHKCFLNVNRQDDGAGNEIETFESTVDAMVDPGGGPVPVTLSGPVTIVTYGKIGNTTGTFDTEIVSMSLTGNAGGMPVEVRESPSLGSLGQTTITDLGGGQWQIDSFFDVFTEISVSGGPFEPQTNGPGRMRLVPIGGGQCECVPDSVACELSDPATCDGLCPDPNDVCTPQTTPVLPSPELPPESQPAGTPDCDQILSQYEGQDVHALFPGGIDFSDPQHKCFLNVNRQDDGSGNEIETFDSTVDGQVDLGSGPVPVTLSGPVTIVSYGKTGNTTGIFQTEMVSMSLTGDVAGIPIEIRESPSSPSTGQTTITDLGGGLWAIDSFFDVFTELSVSGGPFQPQTNGPGRMTLVSTTPNSCECLPAACDLSDPLTCDGPCPNPGEICTADPAGGPCFCETPPVPCELGDPLTCDGPCPIAGDVCTIDSSGGPCFCEAPPVLCEDSFPACDGDCPIDTHCESGTFGSVILPSPDLPPESDPPDPECVQILSQYEGQGVHALFPGGIDFSDPLHKCFKNVNRTDDGSGNEIETFDSTVDGRVDLGGGPVPVTLSGPVTIVSYGKTGNTTGTFDTEIVSMSLTGDVGGIQIEIRESPSLPSPGQTTITDVGGGLWQIDSFFDVFTELSVSGGPFQPQTNGAGRMTLRPTQPVDICQCVPDVVPCELSDPATCGGDCPIAGDVCTIDPSGGPCFCGPPPPVPCEQSSFPTCDGECPPDQACVADSTGLAECVCEPVGGPCTQCGPGAHFIDQCGPFPPVGTDLVANNGAVVGIDLDLDCVKDINVVLRPCPAPNQLLHVDKTLGPIDDSVNFPGTSPVDGHPTGPGLDVIDTEIVAMCLTDGAVTMAAGVGGPAALPLQRSLGTVAEDLSTPDPSFADSIFDVFFEVSGVPGGPLYNQVALQVHGRIDCLPPAANYAHPVGICLPLTTSGVCDSGPNAGSACVNDLDCPGGSCVGTTLLANLVSANHSVNQPVCPESPFPECSGDCPPGEICLPGPTGCECVPEPCEQSPFPECLGDCPPGTHCEPNSTTDSCECVPDIVLCEQSPFPECLGDCPPGTHCEANLANGLCECVPDVVHCEQSPWPMCSGDCPNPGDICMPDDLDSVCVCEPPPPVPCEQSSFPTCDGECPPDQACVADSTGLAECVCEPVGGPCTQCGPGAHFIDQCGPFPPVGTDLVANNGAVVGIDLDLDCVKDINVVLRPCPAPNQLLHVDKTLGPIDDSVNFPGTSPVDGHPTGPGLDVIDTEIVAMCLTDGAVTMAAGVGGPAALPLQPSLGTVAEDLSTPDPSFADSIFDVFFEVSGVPGGPLYNQVALQVHGRIDCLPPAANYAHPVGICLPLTTSGVCDSGPSAGSACVNDLDCPGGSCVGTALLANLVSANHSVNQPVCPESPFPECSGDCPPGEICLPGPTGCECVPEPCEQSPFPECLGDCPPGTICVIDSLTDACRCEPLPPDECEEGLFPACDLPCPDVTETCIPLSATGDCRCVPQECEQGPFPECNGPCPPGLTCEPGAVGGCECLPTDCQGTFYPECDGSCPPNFECKNIPGSDLCDCQPQEPDCEQVGPPVCDGYCPPTPLGLKQTCVSASAAAPCRCVPCIVTAPSGNIFVTFTSKVDLVWTQENCARVYNLYVVTGHTMVDADGNGLADDYGVCRRPDIPITATVHATTPPSTETDFLLITGENPTGEGTMGYNSASMERPNLTPCP